MLNKTVFMFKTLKYTFIILLIFFACSSNSQTDNRNKKEKTAVVLKHEQKVNTQIDTVKKIPLPKGFNRIISKPNSFAEYLQNLKLKKDKTVYSYDGSIIMSDKYGYQYAVIDIDIGNRDLQQCADAIMRLRAEYLYQLKRYKEIHFNFSDGKARYFTSYSKSDYSYKKFRKYMNYIFAYANTATLKIELRKVNIGDMQTGDVFIQQGSPYGHAVIVIDMAENPLTGEKKFMVAQSFMPAQSIHIIKNPDKNNGPWYSLNFGKELRLPSWTFSQADLRRF